MCSNINHERLTTEGKYVIPEYLSDGCKDLISKMLVVDPLRRISILEIK